MNILLNFLLSLTAIGMIIALVIGKYNLLTSLTIIYLQLEIIIIERKRK